MSKEVQDVELTSPIIKDGWMRKKSSRVNVWGDRYFVLRGATLFYYLKSTDSVSFVWINFARLCDLMFLLISIIFRPLKVSCP